MLKLTNKIKIASNLLRTKCRIPKSYLDKCVEKHKRIKKLTMNVSNVSRRLRKKPIAPVRLQELINMSKTAEHKYDHFPHKTEEIFSDGSKQREN